MKPRNEHERRVVALSAKLPGITYKQKMWARKHCFIPIGYTCKGEVWCSQCGAMMLHEGKAKGKKVCPMCGSHLELKASQKKRIKEKVYFTVLARVEEFQVCRHFAVEKRMEKYGYPDYIINEAVQSVADMAEEGAKMRHCVYENGYYKKDESLILSARDHDGNRIETIEVSLKTYDVVQSRGVCNKNTEWHNEIVNLVRSNMHLIRGVA